MPGAAGLRERLARRTAGDDVDLDGAEDRADLFDPCPDRPGPSRRTSPEVVGVGRERIRVVVSAEHDPHSRLLQAQTHAAGAGEEVGSEQLLGFWALMTAGERHQVPYVTAMILVGWQTQSIVHDRCADDSAGSWSSPGQV